MSNDNANSNVSIDDLLDSTLDDLADMPEFKPFPAGAHRVTIKFEQKTVSGIPSIDMGITGIETVELANANDTPIAAGDTTNILFMLKKKDGTPNEIAQGQFKAAMKALSAAFGTSTNRETMEAANGAEVLIVTSVRADKRDANNIKHYTDVKSLQVM